LPRQTLVQHHAERIEIRAGADRLVDDLLWSEIGGRTQDVAVHGEAVIRALYVGEAEIQNPGTALGVDEHVRGFQIAVDDPGRVEGAQGVEQCKRQGLEVIPRAGQRPTRKRVPVDQLGDDELAPRRVEPLVDEAHDPRPVQLPQDGHFASAAGALFVGRIADRLPGDLDGHRPATDGILPGVDVPLAAPPDARSHAVSLQEHTAGREHHGAASN
jgi:hypothetical protein